MKSKEPIKTPSGETIQYFLFSDTDIGGFAG